MSFLSVAFPFPAALPAVEALAGVVVLAARPLFGLGIMAALVMIFKPLLIGLLRAALLVIKPRKTLEERNSRRLRDSVYMLNRMAREYEATQPSQAAELRWLASRDR
jgi:hypothetical protein